MNSVYVLNCHGQPLMPCKPRKARKLLNNNKAKVFKRTPFTIKLLHGSSGYKQEVSLGVDAGTKHIGLSTTTDKKVLFESEVLIRDDISKLLADRYSLRRNRRRRKTRYRKARFLNRKRPKGWLPPSIQNKVDIHKKAIDYVHKILPVTNITIEVAQFDTQKIKNPDISGDLYQKGDQLGFWNVREYVLFRDKHKCQYCKGKSKDKLLNVHHIESRRTGGNSPDNLICLCKTCHNYIHSNNLEHTIKRKSKSLRDASKMNIMRWFIYEKVKKEYPELKLTYGFITKNTRINNNLEKSHVVDARCISRNPLAEVSGNSYIMKQVRRNNRKLHKQTINKGGTRKNNKAPRYLHGYQIFDKVKYRGEECFVFGRRVKGYYSLRKLDGTHIHTSANVKELRLLEKAKTLLIDKQKDSV